MYRDHFTYATSQWKTTLQCKVVPYWLGSFTKWSLRVGHYWSRHRTGNRGKESSLTSYPRFMFSTAVTSQTSRSVSDHLWLDCLFFSFFKLAGRNTSKSHFAGPLWGESTGDRWIPSQKASNTESVSMPWYHLETNYIDAKKLYDIFISTWHGARNRCCRNQRRDWYGCTRFPVLSMVIYSWKKCQSSAQCKKKLILILRKW